MPVELKLYLLLQKLPGYTRRTLLQEPAAIVERWLIAMEEEAREIQAEQARQRMRMKQHA